MKKIEKLIKNKKKYNEKIRKIKLFFYKSKIDKKRIIK